VIQSLPEATLIQNLLDWDDIIKCIVKGPCDALAADSSALYRVAAQNEGLRVLTDSPYTHDHWAIATAKGNMALTVRLSEALAMAEADGSLPDLRIKWSMPAP